MCRHGSVGLEASVEQQTQTLQRKPGPRKAPHWVKALEVVVKDGTVVSGVIPPLELALPTAPSTTRD